MKSILIVFFVIILMASLGFIGCAQTTPAAPSAAATVTKTVTSSPPGSAPATAASKVIELKFLDKDAPGSPTAKVGDLLCQRIMEATGNQVKITAYHAETLGKAADFMDMVNGGVCDIVNLVGPYYPTKLEMELGLELPAVGIKTTTAGYHLRWDLFYQGYFKGLEAFKMLAFYPSTPLNLFVRDKKITKLDDFKGLKIRTPDVSSNKLVEKFGATPVTMAATDLYMALERGTLDGIVTGQAFIIGQKIYEVTKYAMMNPPFQQGCMFIVMSKKAWNSLPLDIQFKIEQTIPRFGYEMDRVVYEQALDSPNILRQNKMELYELSEIEKTRYFQAAAPIITDWVADKQAKGLPAKEMMDKVPKILARYQ